MQRGKGVADLDQPEWGSALLMSGTRRSRGVSGLTGELARVDAMCCRKITCGWNLDGEKTRMKIRRQAVLSLRK
jgi:hypothetical protein